MPHIQARATIGIAMIIIAVLQTEIPIIIINIIFGLLILLFYKIPVFFLIQKLKPLLFFVIFSFVFFPIYEGGDGVIKALVFTGRLLFVAEVFTYILYQTPMTQLLKALYKLKVPSIFIELMMFTLRFMEVFSKEAKAMLLSIKGRGFYTGSWFHLKKYKILGSLLGSLFVRSIHRSERIYLGMLSRGYSQQLFLDDEEQIPKRDWILNFCWLIIMISIFVSYRWWGYFNGTF